MVFTLNPTLFEEAAVIDVDMNLGAHAERLGCVEGGGVGF